MTTTIEPCERSPAKVDRIDTKGNIREHLTRDGHRTIYDVKIGPRPTPSGNALP